MAEKKLNHNSQAQLSNTTTWINQFFLVNHLCQIVKLQSQVQTSVLGLGVDFVLPLAQQQDHQEQEEEPQQKLWEFQTKDQATKPNQRLNQLNH